MAVRSVSTKLVANVKRNNQNHAVYDLESDLSERENISWQSPEKTQQLIDAWEKWNKPMKDRVFPTLGADDWWEHNL